jgi:filamentous hemagglutinin
MPADGLMREYGVAKNDGVSMFMEQPQTGGRHRRTRTYGAGPDFTETPSVELERDISDVRRIYQEDNLYTPVIRRALIRVRALNKRLYPTLFN